MMKLGCHISGDNSSRTSQTVRPTTENLKTNKFDSIKMMA